MTTNSALYQRVSDGTDKSVDEQNAANEAAAATFGWRTTSYSDAVSASRFGRRARPGWARLMADVAAGKYQNVILWEGSRGDRKLTSWSAFLDSCRDTGTNIYITSRARLYDMQNSEDWETLARQGVKNAVESEDTSLRVRRGVTGAADSGIPFGRIPYGYRRTYTSEPGRKKPLPHQEPHPDEAPLVEEIITRISKSDAISAIIKDLAARNVRTRAGGRWSRGSVTRLVTEGVVYIGKRRQNGGPLLDGNWPAIVDPGIYWRAVAVLADPARKPRGGGIRPGNARWLLSYLATCDKCGGPLSVRHTPRSAGQKPPYYRCLNYGCVSAPVEWLDALITAGIVATCSHPILYKFITGEEDQEAQSVRDEAQAERDRLADFEEQAITGEISAASFARIAKRIEARIAELDTRAQQLSVPPALRDLVGAPVPDRALREKAIAKRWAGMPVTAQRHVVATLCAPRLRPVGDSKLLDPHRVSFNSKIKASR
jgi:site-specific DNA recombinase